MRVFNPHISMKPIGIIGMLVILLVLVAIASLSPVLATRQEPPKYTPTATIECVCAPPVTPFPTATYTKRRQ